MLKAAAPKAQCGPSTGSSEAVTPPLRADPPSPAPGAPPGFVHPELANSKNKHDETDGIPPAPSRGPACFYFYLCVSASSAAAVDKRQETSRGNPPYVPGSPSSAPPLSPFSRPIHLATTGVRATVGGKRMGEAALWAA